MATIRTAAELEGNIGRITDGILNAVNIILTVMEQMQTVMSIPEEPSALDRAGDASAREQNAVFGDAEFGEIPVIRLDHVNISADIGRMRERLTQAEGRTREPFAASVSIGVSAGGIEALWERGAFGGFEGFRLGVRAADDAGNAEAANQNYFSGRDRFSNWDCFLNRDRFSSQAFFFNRDYLKMSRSTENRKDFFRNNTAVRDSFDGEIENGGFGSYRYFNTARRFEKAYAFFSSDGERIYYAEHLSEAALPRDIEPAAIRLIRALSPRELRYGKANENFYSAAAFSENIRLFSENSAEADPFGTDGFSYEDVITAEIFKGSALHAAEGINFKLCGMSEIFPQLRTLFENKTPIALEHLFESLGRPIDGEKFASASKKAEYALAKAGNAAFDVFEITAFADDIAAQNKSAFFSSRDGEAVGISAAAQSAEASRSEHMRYALETVYGGDTADILRERFGELAAYAENAVYNRTEKEREIIMPPRDLWSMSMEESRIAYGETADSGRSLGGIIDIPFLKELGAVFFMPLIENRLRLSESFAERDGIGGSGEANEASLDVSEEDLKLLREIAPQEAFNGFGTAEIKIEQHNTNNISSSMDLEDVIEGLTAAVGEAALIIAEGVHI